MFLFPSGLLLGGDFSIGDYLIWNEIPTVIGNLVGGLAFVGLTLYATHARTAAPRPRADGSTVSDSATAATDSETQPPAAKADAGARVASAAQ
jgi:ABC-type xylose transport system permease subunit